MKETICNFKKVYKCTKGQGKNLIKYLILSAAICGIYVLVPILTSRQLVGLTNSLWEELLVVTFLIFVVENLSNLIRFLNQKYSQIFFRETLKDIQTKIGKGILNIEVSSIDSHNTGVFTQRLANDTSSLSKVFSIGGRLITNIITDIGVFVAIFVINKMFFLYYITITLIFLFLQKRRVVEIEKQEKKYKSQNEKTSGLTAELVRGIRDIKMLNAEETFMKEINKNINTLNEYGYEMSDVGRKYMLVIDFFKDLNNLLLALLIIYFINKDYLNISLGVVIFSYRNHVFDLVRNVGSLLDYVKDFNISCDRVFSILDSDEFKKETFGDKHLDKIDGNFEFKNVKFGYNSNKLILNNMNFKIKAGETVAFVGKSGVGKSTIFSLLCKMYDVKDGCIKIDGVDISTLDKESIRGNVTIISQNPYIFNMSIKENLKLVKEDLTDDEIKEACRLSCLNDFISNLPNGYDTIVGEGGISLSGGQRQRLAIARAFVQKTKIILFDEATSALDNETQAHIQRAINNMKKDYTILIIAHRLSTIRNVDRILYIDDGRVIQEGTHESLLKNCNEYKKLYEAEIYKDN